MRGAQVVYKSDNKRLPQRYKSCTNPRNSHATGPRLTSVSLVSVSAPVLIVGFNRPEHLAGTIRALAISEPKTVLLAIDGPRQDKPSDLDLCTASQRCVDLIAWPCEVRTRFRSQNLGIRYAVADAVTWAVDLYGSVIVLEDDAEPGPDAVSFANKMLQQHASDNHIGHINLYNVVPEIHLSTPHLSTRLSRYPESYAWATWHRAWKHYDDNLSWTSEKPILRQVLKDQGYWRSRKWTQNLHDARTERIDTWAYRWIATLWRHGFVCVSPNRNLVRYTGQQGGTHTRRRQRWSELDVSILPTDEFGPSAIDHMADAWLARKIFRETQFGYIEGLVASSALGLLRAIQRS